MDASVCQLNHSCDSSTSRIEARATIATFATIATCVEKGESLNSKSNSISMLKSLL